MRPTVRANIVGGRDRDGVERFTVTIPAALQASGFDDRAEAIAFARIWADEARIREGEQWTVVFRKPVTAAGAA